MNISQPEDGESGESVAVVNQSLLHPSIYGAVLAIVLLKIIINFRNSDAARNPFDCAGSRGVWLDRWVRDRHMFEAITALFGVMSAGIFIAHAVDGYRSRL